MNKRLKFILTKIWCIVFLTGSYFLEEKVVKPNFNTIIESPILLIILAVLGMFIFFCVIVYTAYLFTYWDWNEDFKL